MNEGYNATILGLPGISRAAEESMISRDLILAETYGLHVHIQHVSTRGGVRMIREAKNRGVKVTAESAPHYFSADDSYCLSYDGRTRVNPPLRTTGDVEAVKEGLLDGTLDAIATDHAPHHRDEKHIEFALAASGIIGFETAFSLAVTNLTDDAAALAKLLSVNPARIIGKPGGVIKEGVPGDITIADMDTEYVLTEANIVSRGKKHAIHRTDAARRGYTYDRGRKTGIRRRKDMQIDRLCEAIQQTKCPVCVGLDTELSHLPKEYRPKGQTPAAISEGVFRYNCDIMDEISGVVPSVKVQAAYYEQYGTEGMKCFLDTMAYAKGKGLVVIADVKRNDIGSTAKAYANAYIRNSAADFITVNAYLGSDGTRAVC